MSNPEPRRLIAALSACNFVIGMGAFVVVGLLNPLADGFAISSATAGWIMTVYALAYAVLSPVLVSLTGATGRRKIMTAGLMLFAVGMALIILAPSFGTVLAGRAIAAAGAGLFTPVAAAVAAGLSPPEARGRALAAVFFGLTLAQVLGVPAGSWIAYSFGWRAAIALVFLLALPCVWIVWTRVPQGLRFQPVTLADLGAVVTNPTQMIAVLYTTTLLSATYVVYTYLAPLLADQMAFDRDGITLVLLVFGLGAVLGNLAGGWLADRIGAVRTLVLVALSQIVILPWFSTLPLPGAIFFPFIFCWSVFGWSFMAAQQMRLISLSPDSAPVILALNAAAIYVGAAVGSAIGGVVINSAGLGTLGIVAGVVSFVALGNILWSHRMVQIHQRSGMS